MKSSVSPDDAAVLRQLRASVGLRIHLDELGIVVEHFLEVRDRPGPLGAIAMEAAADLIVDAAQGHVIQRHRDHLDDVGRLRPLAASYRRKRR